MFGIDVGCQGRPSQIKQLQGESNLTNNTMTNNPNPCNQIEVEFIYSFSIN